MAKSNYWLKSLIVRLKILFASQRLRRVLKFDLYCPHRLMDVCLSALGIFHKNEISIQVCWPESCCTIACCILLHVAVSRSLSRFLRLTKSSGERDLDAEKIVYGIRTRICGMATS